MFYFKIYTCMVDFSHRIRQRSSFSVTDAWYKSSRSHFTFYHSTVHKYKCEVIVFGFEPELCTNTWFVFTAHTEQTHTRWIWQKYIRINSLRASWNKKQFIISAIPIQCINIHWMAPHSSLDYYWRSPQFPPRVQSAYTINKGFTGNTGSNIGDVH